ncbi:MAG: phosphonate transport system substrate-binding protein [bacterium]|jgi:phosphonate transport system substrate-binding protein
MTKIISFSSKILIFIIVFSNSIIWANTLVIGTINSGDPAKAMKKYLPLAHYLGSHLYKIGITKGKVRITKTISDMAQLLKKNKIDLYIDSPFPIIHVSLLSGSKPLLRRWKKGVAQYNAVIFTYKGSGIQTLADLKGRLIAMEDLYSSSGYLLPKLVMKQKGFQLKYKKSMLEPISSKKIGYVFTHGEENTMIWVLKKKIVAGVLDNNSYQELAKNKISTLNIIHKTFPISRHIVSHRGNLSSEFIAKIKQVLLQMNQSKDGLKALHAFEKTKKFDEIPKHSKKFLLQAQQFIIDEGSL